MAKSRIVQTQTALLSELKLSLMYDSKPQKSWQLFCVASPVNIFRDVSFSFLLYEISELLWSHGSVVNTDFVDQAGEVGSGFHILAATNIKAAV